MEYKNILCEVEGNVATITFNRPKALNALNYETISELDDALDKCKADENVKAVILTGSGDKAFVAGADITELKDKPPVEVMPFIEHGHGVFKKLEDFDKPTIAAINGFALGGGEEVSMCCDLRYASENARFGQPEILLGIIPGWGGTQRLTRLIGIGRSKELNMLGGNITAQRAYEVGLVNRVFPADQLMPEVKKIAERLAGMPPFAIKMAKYAINYGYDLSLDAARALEIQCVSQCFSTQDSKEGTSAFLEKRKPTFTGK